MLNPTSIMAGHFGDYLSELYLQYFSNRRPEYAAYLGGAARLVLERIGNSDALYHNVEHTMMVTLVGQQILRGRQRPRWSRPSAAAHRAVARRRLGHSIQNHVGRQRVDRYLLRFAGTTDISIANCVTNQPNCLIPQFF